VSEGKGNRCHQAKGQIEEYEEETANAAMPVEPEYKSVETMHTFPQIFLLVASSGEIGARADQFIMTYNRFYVERQTSLTCCASRGYIESYGVRVMNASARRKPP